MDNLDFELLPIYILKIKKKLDKLINSDLKEYDINCIQFKPIAILYHYSDLSLNELTKKIGLDKANITRVISDLKKKNLVYQIEDKKRGYKISLTDKGKMLASDIIEKNKGMTKKVFSNFSEEEKEQFLKLIIKYFESVNKIMEVNDEKNS